MSSSNKTPLGFNIWAGTDTPKREDFNEDNRIVDENISSLKTGKANIATTGLVSGISASGFVGSGYYSKIDKQVVLNALFISSAVIVSGTSIATLPTGFRPNMQIWTPCSVATSNGIYISTPAILSFLTSGDILIYAPPADSAQIYAVTSFNI